MEPILLEDSEADLLKRIADGDQQAFLALFHRTRDAVWRVVRALTMDDARAEDALQETYLAVWRSATAFRRRGSARAWIYGVARRQAARTFRHRAGEPSHPVPLHELGAQAGWGRDPEELTAAIEDQGRLRAGLERLSAQDRDVIVLCDLEGLSAPEAGGMLGLTANAIRVRLHRARLRLMAQLRAEGSDA